MKPIGEITKLIQILMPPRKYTRDSPGTEVHAELQLLIRKQNLDLVGINSLDNRDFLGLLC